MKLDDQFVKPRYDAGGFAGIPSRLRAHLASGQYDAVALFLVDGLGWRFIDHPHRFACGGERRLRVVLL